MQKLSFQDAFFLRAETPSSPFHVASLMIFSPPDNAPDNYLSELVKNFDDVRELWPVFGRKLNTPDTTRNACWVDAEDFDPNDHVLHYSLPKNGTMDNLLALLARAHEQLLDRSRPLWQAHIIEGLEGGKFAVYFKVHHALIDGVGGLRMIQGMLSGDPSDPLRKPIKHEPSTHHTEESIASALKHSVSAVLKQAKALPEAYSMLTKIGLDNLLGRRFTPHLPFTAPRTILNKELTSRRRFIVGELPLERVKEIGKHYGGTINDVLVAIFGGAIREYLLSQKALPEQSLDAGLPVSIKSDGKSDGNQLSMIVCPFGTDESNAKQRLKAIIKTTKKGKADISHISPEAAEDIAAINMVPFLMISLTHSSQRFPPAFNSIVSNVPGPKEQMYLHGAKLEKIYPLSIVTDGMGLNLTVISYNSKLCIGITSAPGSEPGIEALNGLIDASYQQLLQTIEEPVPA